MPSGLCAECGPGGAKKLVSSKQIRKVKMVMPDQCRQCGARELDHLTAEGHAFIRPSPIYLCNPCRRALGYA